MANLMHSDVHNPESEATVKATVWDRFTALSNELSSFVVKLEGEVTSMRCSIGGDKWDKEICSATIKQTDVTVTITIKPNDSDDA